MSTVRNNNSSNNTDYGKNYVKESVLEIYCSKN